MVVIEALLDQSKPITSCVGLWEEGPHTAPPMSFTWASHMAASVLTGQYTLPNQSTCLCHITDAVVDCEVNEWEAWGACSKTCGFGTRSRTREVIQEPRNYGTPCPLLTEDELCGSMRSCGWKHFNFGGKRNQWARSRTWIQS